MNTKRTNLKMENVDNSLDILNVMVNDRVEGFKELEKNVITLNKEVKDIELTRKNVDEALIAYKRGNLILTIILVFMILLTCSVIIIILLLNTNKNKLKQ